MKRDEAGPSETELSPEIRRVLRSPSTASADATPTDVEPDLEAGLKQRERRSAQDALHVADQLLGSGGSGGPGRAATAGRDVCLDVSGQRFWVTRDGTDIGRDPDSGGIVVVDPRVSRQHARFLQIEGALAVVDLGSTNGTVIVRGNERVEVASKPVVLILGDRVATLNGVPLAVVVAGSLG